ncbi:NADP-dependent oxidoreductase [Plantibacter sp. YIM 135347]|uniref:NADP-dependent oxidoreductase n=1 Tax=Plantibacter sp. YIM 135347 TaxID=3423919 RepID=UPI003D3472F7
MRHRIGHSWSTTAVAERPRPVPETMRAALIDGTGSAEVFRIGSIPTPDRVNAEYLVKVVAAGVNPIDAKTRAGRGVSGAIPAYPTALGFDFSGIVVQAPFEASELQPGDEVYGVTSFPRTLGSYAEYVVVSSLGLAKKPTTLSHVEAGGVPLAALTAWGMVVDVAKAHEGQRILIHAGSGGVGHFAVQFASYFGAQVVTTGSTQNLPWLRELGASQVVDHTATRFEDVVRQVDVVIDLVGNTIDDTGTRSLSILRPGGLIVNAPTGTWPSFLDDTQDAGVRATTYKVAPDGGTLDTITRLLESGDVRVFVDEVFDLEDVADAHAALERGHTRGKLVVKVAEG